MEQHSWGNIVELSSIPNSILDEDLENNMINTCNESGIAVEAISIEKSHRLPLSRNSRGHNKRIIVKFSIVNTRKDKNRIIGKKLGHLHVINKVFVSASLCPYYKYIWGKCKDMQKQGKVHHIFCLDNLVCIKLSEKGSSVKLLHSWLLFGLKYWKIIFVYIAFALILFSQTHIVTFQRPTLSSLVFHRKLILATQFIFYWLLLFHLQSQTKYLE